MNVERVRRLCLRLPQAKENLQWGETLCFKVEGRLFALLSLDAVPPSLTLKSSGERSAELTELPGIVPAPYVGRYGWVMLERLNVLPAGEVEALILESYRAVAEKRRGATSRRATGQRPGGKRAR